MPCKVPALPPRVLIDFATKCNLRCPMCPVWGSREAQSVAGMMPVDRARSIINEIAEAKPLVQPNMYGEPLLVPDLRERITQMKAKGMRVAMNTNGLTLDADMARFFRDAKVDSVMVSIDARTRETLKKVRGIFNLSRIEQAVFTLLRERRAAVYPRIGVSFTITEANKHEAVSFVDRWVKVVDVVRLGLLFENGTFPGMIVPTPRLPCPALYDTMPIHHDGTVSICCLDGFKSQKMGNVCETSVRDVWHGEAFTKVRAAHEAGDWDAVPFCKGCNGWAQASYTEEERDGLLIRSSPQYVYYNKISKLNSWHRGNGGDSGSDAKPPEYRFNNVTCSQCGGEFGPADNGFSHCENHKHLPRLG